jgi:cell filamentation protein
MYESSDPYTYPETDVLRNILDIRDPHLFADFEANATAARLAELDAAPHDGSFDTAHLKAIHRHVFQDVYSWAGEFRTVNISKGGQLFGVAAFLEAALADILRKLSAENYLKKAEAALFAMRAGFYLGEINAVHPFREGNGRAQREFIRDLAVQAGFGIDWGRITRDEMIAASRASFETGDSSGLGNCVYSCLADI